MTASPEQYRSTSPHHSEWEIETACDVRLGPVLRELSAPGIQLCIDINPEAVASILDQLDPNVPPGTVHITLAHGDSMSSPTDFGSCSYIKIDEEGGDTAAYLNHIMIKTASEEPRSARTQDAFRQLGLGTPPPSTHLASASDVNTTLVHELQHAVDLSNPSQQHVQKEVTFRQRRRFRDLGAAIVAGSGVVIAGSSLGPSSHTQEILPSLGYWIGVEAVGIAASLSVLSSLGRRTREYINRYSPLEKRAYRSEKQAPHLPQAIQIGYELQIHSAEEEEALVPPGRELTRDCTNYEHAKNLHSSNIRAAADEK